MLQLKGIRKVYKTSFSEQVALKGIDLTFKEGEFVSILGPSGCGKTTMLNIIGGLDRYSSGDLIINGKSTKNFTTSDWDAYRNHSVGFVFQNYNLIHHISILENVELGMTLSGVSQSERREKAIDVLKRVGLEEHMKKRPNQLSGGQKQRVAIARALVNNPDVILADEPTGALDTKTSSEVLDLIKEISKEKLVIMVTHNKELAEMYSSRIVRLLDGEVIEDTKPCHEVLEEEKYKPNKTAMSFLTALKLSFNNLRTKKIRTLITALAGSIGIIGIALVLSISNGFSSTISDLEQSTFSGFPLQINKYQFITSGPKIDIKDDKELGNELIPYDPIAYNRHENIITDEYLSYLDNLDKNLYSSLQYVYGLDETLLVDTGNGVKTVSQKDLKWDSLYDDDEFTKSQYDILSGHLPEKDNEIVVIVDSKNQINESILEAFGLSTDKTIKYDALLGKQLTIGSNDDVYFEVDGKYTKNTDLTKAYLDGEKLTVVGVLRGKSEGLQSSNRGVYHKSSLTNKILNENKNSNVCVAQMNSDSIIVTGENIGITTTKDDVLQYLGCSSTPTSILIYPKNTDAKDTIKSYLDSYNTNKSSDMQILYTDISDVITSTLGKMVNMISSVLVAFAAISLVVSSIMIGIITYVSVLERTKEIGILRSLGARKKDISRVFNAETVIIGFAAGSIGILITFILSFPINIILSKLTQGLDKVVQMSIVQSLSLIGISIILTFVAGLIPSRIAAKKDPVEALRHNE